MYKLSTRTRIKLTLHGSMQRRTRKMEREDDACVRVCARGERERK